MRAIVVQCQNGLHRAITHILISRNVFFNFVFADVCFCAVRGVRAVRKLKAPEEGEGQNSTQGSSNHQARPEGCRGMPFFAMRYQQPPGLALHPGNTPIHESSQ